MPVTVSKIHIGNLTIANNSVLAPMAGITDRAFRNIAARFGAGLVISEMVASAALSCGNKEMQRKLAPTKGSLHAIQLAGCEAHWMERAAHIATDAGADIIDINFGCPAKRVTNGFAGSALMRVPDQALRLVEAVARATAVPVTVKMRLGWDEDNLNAAQIARSAVDAGAKMITVHARTREQFFKGEARWHLVRSVAEAVDVPVLVNGDIGTAAGARQALEQSGAAGVMIGRAAQGQPWLVGNIARELKGATNSEVPAGPQLGALVKEHYEAVLSEHGMEVGLRVARKHIGWYLDRTTQSQSRWRDLLLRATDVTEVLANLDAAFSHQAMEAA